MCGELIEISVHGKNNFNRIKCTPWVCVCNDNQQEEKNTLKGEKSQKE